MCYLKLWLYGQMVTFMMSNLFSLFAKVPPPVPAEIRTYLLMAVSSQHVKRHLSGEWSVTEKKCGGAGFECACIRREWIARRQAVIEH